MGVESKDILAELKLARKFLGELSPSTLEPSEHSVWLLYSQLERLVAVFKFRLGVERPGVFIKLPHSETPEVFLRRASEGVDTAVALLEEGKQEQGLESMRTARTSLRAYLNEKRLARMRAARRNARAKKTS